MSYVQTSFGELVREDPEEVIDRQFHPTILSL